jgi:outer membrane receptor protein involved in Fe transport
MINITIGDTKKPNLYLGFVKTSFDVGNLSVLTGLSFATGHSRVYHREGNHEHAFAGKTKLYGFDLTAKYVIGSHRDISFQGEYIYRDQKGTKYEYDNAGDLETEELKKKQGGFYTQLVFKFDRRWRAGVQYNLINKNDVKKNGENLNLPNHLPAYYAMLEYNPTEFSRIRFQVGQNRAFFHDGSRKTVNEFILQFNFAIGAHEDVNFWHP